MYSLLVYWTRHLEEGATPVSKASKAEIERRIGEVLQLLVSGVPRHTIVAAYAGRWGVSPRQVDSYLSRAREALRSGAAFDRPLEVGRAIARYDVLYAKALSEGNWRLAMQIERTRAQLLGLNAPTELRHSGDAESPIAFRDLSRLSETDLAEAARLADLLKEDPQ
jgi:hypothetical protein